MFLIHNALKRANKTYYILIVINLNLAFEFNLNSYITLKPPGPQILRQPKSDFQDSVFNFTVQYLY